MTNTKRNHIFWMVLACVIPLIIIFLLPVFGVKNNYIVFTAIVFMVGVHLFMMKNHNHDKHKDTNFEIKNNKIRKK